MQIIIIIIVSKTDNYVKVNIKYVNNNNYVSEICDISLEHM